MDTVETEANEFRVNSLTDTVAWSGGEVVTGARDKSPVPCQCPGVAFSPPVTGLAVSFPPPCWGLLGSVLMSRADQLTARSSEPLGAARSLVEELLSAVTGRTVRPGPTMSLVEG